MLSDQSQCGHFRVANYKDRTVAVKKIEKTLDVTRNVLLELSVVSVKFIFNPSFTKEGPPPPTPKTFLYGFDIKHIRECHVHSVSHLSNLQEIAITHGHKIMQIPIEFVNNTIIL